MPEEGVQEDFAAYLPVRELRQVAPVIDGIHHQGPAGVLVEQFAKCWCGLDQPSDELRQVGIHQRQVAAEDHAG